MAQMTAAIFDNSGNEITGFKSLKINIVRTARIIGAPVESGQTSFDNKVLDPAKVVVTGVIVIDSAGQYKRTISKLNTMFANREYKFYRVCDGTAFANNLILEQFPRLRDVDKYDFINIELVFKEALLIQKETAEPSDDGNSDMRNLGSMVGTAVSLAASYFTGITW